MSATRTLLHKLIWNGMNVKREDALAIAEMLNATLVVANRVTLVQLTESWYIISGNDIAIKEFAKLKIRYGIKDDEAKAAG